MTEKTIENWLIINWQDASTRTRKTKHDSLGPYEIQTPLNVDVVVPDVDVEAVSQTVEVPTPKVQSAVVEAIDDEDLLPWQKAAREVVYEAIEDDEAQGLEVGDEEYEALVESLTYRAQVRAENSPTPAVVHDHVENALFGEVEG